MYGEGLSDRHEHDPLHAERACLAQAHGDQEEPPEIESTYLRAPRESSSWSSYQLAASQSLQEDDLNHQL